jgi:predicted dehydrogenase
VVNPETPLFTKPKNQIMNQKIKIGVIGAGRWGPNLIGAFNRMDGVELTRIADINPIALQSLSNRFPTLQTTTSKEQLFEDESIDAIVICTPVETHMELVQTSLNAGKHVFVEKPFGQDSEYCNQLCKLADKKGLQILVGHVFLFNASIVALKKIINSGELGELLHLEAHRTNLGPVRKDVNAVWDLTSHDLSIFDFLLDDLPIEVSCIGSCRLDPKNEDTSYTTFKYKDGLLAHAHASWLNPRKVRQITVIGSKKMVIWDDLNLEHPITIFDSSIGLDQSYYSDSFASHRLSYNRGNVVLPNISNNEPLFDELKHFMNVIQGKENNRSTGKYGTELAKTLQCADQSIQNGGKFIEISR